MKIALTGGSGGIGRAVAALASAEGHSIVSIDRSRPAGAFSGPRIDYVAADVCDYAVLLDAMKGCDALVHMAAIPSPMRDPDHVVHNNNVVGSYNALRAAIECGINRVCQASSVNAIGLSFSREAHFDYLPLDEQHPPYCEDAYSLSKWICEQQADSIARRYRDMTIASLRFHWVVPNRETSASRFGQATREMAKHLWAYTLFEAAARACLQCVTAAYAGHEVFYIIAPETNIDRPSLDLAAEFFPKVPIRGDLSGRRSFFSCAKADRMLRQRHD